MENLNRGSRAKLFMFPQHNKWTDWSEVTGEQQRGDRFPLMRLVRYESSAPLDQLDQEAVSHGEEGAGLTVNVGNGGLCLLIEHAPQVHEVLRLHVPMPVPWARTPTLAEVRWVRHLPFGWEGLYAVGLKFLL